MILVHVVKISKLLYNMKMLLSRAYISNISAACTCHLKPSDFTTFLNMLYNFNLCQTFSVCLHPIPKKSLTFAN